MKKRAFAIAVAVICAIAYANGCRVISLAEIPSSHRPWQMFLDAEYGAEHLTQAEHRASIFDILQ